MIKNYQITPFQQAHLKAASELHRLCLEEFWSLPTLRQTIAEAHALAYVALIPPLETLVGFIVGRIIVDEAEILALVVAPNFRQQGVGKGLIKKFLHEAYKKGAQYFYLEVAENNNAALKIYSTCGFEKYGERAGYYFNKDRSNKTAILLRLKKN